MATDWVAKMKETFQPHVPEPIEAVGLLQPAGTWGSFGLSEISPLLGMLKRKGVNQKAGGLAKSSTFGGTKMAGIVITGPKVYAFRCKPKGGNWQVQDQLAAWDRKDVKFTVTPKKITNLVEIDVASTGEHFALEATTVGAKGIHDGFFATIAK
jgi:hypothetical protein